MATYRHQSLDGNASRVVVVTLQYPRYAHIVCLSLLIYLLCSGWTTWADWLDLDPPKKHSKKDNLRETLERKEYSKTNYLPFEEARAFVHKQELTMVRPSSAALLRCPPPLPSVSQRSRGGKTFSCLSSHTTAWRV